MFWFTGQPFGCRKSGQIPPGPPPAGCRPRRLRAGSMGCGPVPGPTAPTGPGPPRRPRPRCGGRRPSAWSETRSPGHPAAGAPGAWSPHSPALPAPARNHPAHRPA
ncbi:hypothetical protein B5F27_11930 [Faecalibacterium sp. An192]|nr:hypothetical protein B5F27_11930 [Faecalibacterium sp. An192]